MNPVSAFALLWVNYRLTVWTLREIELWFASSSDGCHHTWLIQRLGGRYPISLCPQSPISQGQFYLEILFCVLFQNVFFSCVWLYSSNSIAPALAQALVIPIGSWEFPYSNPFTLHWSSLPRKGSDTWLLQPHCSLFFPLLTPSRVASVLYLEHDCAPAWGPLHLWFLISRIIFSQTSNDSFSHFIQDYALISCLP